MGEDGFNTVLSMRGLIAITGVATMCTIIGCGGGTPDGCRAHLDRGVLPSWARAGFSDPRPRMPHALGRSGQIAALVFGDPLSAPPSPTHDNKILWVARTLPRTADDLSIIARRYRSGHPTGASVTRVVARGPGPSVVNLPVAGCWRLDLHWGTHTDTVDLQYVRGS